MENVRTLFFPRYPETRDDRLKRECDSVHNAESRYDHYKKNFAGHDASRRQIARVSDPSS